MSTSIQIAQTASASTKGGIHAMTKPYSGAGIGLSLNTAFHSGYEHVTMEKQVALWPFIPNNTFAIDQVVLEVVTGFSTGKLSISIYDDLNGKPNNRLYVSNQIDASTPGYIVTPLNFTFTAGETYWIGFNSSSAVIEYKVISYNWSYQFAWLNSNGTDAPQNLWRYEVVLEPATEPATIDPQRLVGGVGNVPSFNFRAV
jgi:hypothetical protein